MMMMPEGVLLRHHRPASRWLIRNMLRIAQSTCSRSAVLIAGWSACACVRSSLSVNIIAQICSNTGERPAAVHNLPPSTIIRSTTSSDWWYLSFGGRCVSGAAQRSVERGTRVPSPSLSPSLPSPRYASVYTMHDVYSAIPMIVTWH